MGYGADGGEADDVVDRAQAEIYAVTERRTSEDYLPLADIMQGTLDEIEAISTRGGAMVGVPTGFADLDEPDQRPARRPADRRRGPARHGQVARWGWTSAGAASIKHRLTSVIFSLEMSRNEITMRLLSAEARVALHHMRSGTMSDDDWTRLARTMGNVAEAPLFIDDSPNMSMMEIRAKCRRLKQRHDLRLVVIDYLQLMTSGKRVESPPAGGRRVLPEPQAARQGARGPGHRDLPAQPWPRAAHRQAARSCPTCASPARSSRTPTW